MEHLSLGILETVNFKEKELNDPNFTFFSTAVMQSLLGPSIDMYYVYMTIQLLESQ